jgi:hypothetical protein
VLEKAETDTEKFAALFLVPKLVKSADCDKNARMHLVEAMGYSFLGNKFYRYLAPVFRIRIRMDPHSIGRLDPDLGRLKRAKMKK